MARLCERLQGVSGRVWRWFFPRRIDPPECLLELLRFVYPTVDWSRVSFHEGWPHVLGFSPNAAITLPATYSLDRIHIHVKPGRWNPCDRRRLGLVVHEGFHVLQIRDMAGGWGPGFARPFIVQYLACWAANGFKYAGHPIEDAAYAVAGRSSSLYETCSNAGARLPCDCSTDPPAGDAAGLADFRANCQHVVQKTSGANFWTDLARCTPGLMALHRVARRLVGLPYLVVGIYYAVWLLLWSVVTVVLWLVKVVIELLGAVTAGIMWAVTGLVCALGWLWHRVRALR